MTPDDVLFMTVWDIEREAMRFNLDVERLVVWELDREYQILRDDGNTSRLGVCNRCHRYGRVWRSGICLQCRPPQPEWEERLRQQRRANGLELPLASADNPEIQ